MIRSAKTVRRSVLRYKQTWTRSWTACAPALTRVSSFTPVNCQPFHQPIHLKTTEADSRIRGDVHKQQVDELLHAMEARDNILRNIGAKLSEMYEKGTSLATLLDQAYAYRIKRLEGLNMPVADQRAETNDKTKANAA
jgi:hypothetical protein